MLLQRLSLLIVLMCSRPKSGHSSLLTFPRDTEVLVNQSTYFNCSTSILSEQIHWYHNHVGENQTNYVYYKGQFNQIYADRYSIEINIETGEYNLISRSVKPGDAGRYVCQDDGGLGDLSSAELIVLETTPTCLSSMKPDGVVGPNSCNLPLETLQLSCSVSYNGNIPPILQWKMSGNDDPILEGIATNYSGKHATVNLTMSSTVEMDGDVFTCGSKRSHDKQLSCTTDAVNINYAVGQPTIILNITKGVNVTCSANASVPCTYRWFYDNDTHHPVSFNQVLTTDRLGDHRCEASCPIKGINCTFVAMRIIVFEEEPPTASKDTTKTLLIAIIIPTVAVLLITTCILFHVIRKGQKKPTAADEVIKENSGLNAKTPILDEIYRLLPSGGSSCIQKSIEDTKIITKALTESGRAIAGVAILDDLLYVVRDNRSEVETFDTITFELKNIYDFPEDLVNPWDLASYDMNRYLYVMNRSLASTSNHVISLRIDTGASVMPELVLKWSTGEEYGNLSVTGDGNVIVTFCDSGRLVIYRPDGKEMKVMSLSEDMIHPSHALKMSNGQFLICHGINKDNSHRVCILNENCEIIKKSSERMETPSYLAVDEAGLVYVVDQGKSRVIVLSSDLNELIREEVASKKNELGLPCSQRICFNVKAGCLVVVDNNA